MKIIQLLLYYLAYPQISCRLTSQVDIIKSLEAECGDRFTPEFKEIADNFLIRFAEVVENAENPNVKCENPVCTTSDRAHKSCSKCGVRYCSQTCQIEHWKLPENPHKSVCSEDSLFRTVGKIYRDRYLYNDSTI
jgi:hypothetical protein